ncbi:MAG: hypothetical protein IKZ67_02785, partial [Paludibacteraceae bacterium]|nr:hypothetical protein [Paludibacteraceae bacterium]
HQAQPPRRRRLIAGGKEGRKKAAELCGFAAWNVREGILIQRIICPVPVILLCIMYFAIHWVVSF